jgi:hypothetical protein
MRRRAKTRGHHVSRPGTYSRACVPQRQAVYRVVSTEVAAAAGRKLERRKATDRLRKGQSHESIPSRVNACRLSCPSPSEPRTSPVCVSHLPSPLLCRCLPCTYPGTSYTQTSSSFCPPPARQAPPCSLSLVIPRGLCTALLR